MITLEEGLQRLRSDSISLVYDPVDYINEHSSHTYFQVSDLRIYVPDSELWDLEKQCKELGIAVYIFS
jgi:hypothetical protein